MFSRKTLNTFIDTIILLQIHVKEKQIKIVKGKPKVKNFDLIFIKNDIKVKSIYKFYKFIVKLKQTTNVCLLVFIQFFDRLIMSL